MLHPVKDAMPEDGVSRLAMQVSAEPAVPEPVVMARLIEAELPVTVFPLASSTVTAGCCANAVPPVALLLGSVEKTNCAAAPGVMLNPLLVTPVKPALLVANV
jgi:hypothetical protein